VHYSTQGGKVQMETRIKEMLKELGVPMGNKGFKYLVFAIKKTAENGCDIGKITQTLYPEVAKAFETTPMRVERAMRHSIETIFYRTKREIIERYFGVSVGQKLTNRNFIAAMANEIDMKMATKEDNQ
jgi:two-component system, response regulator, stage 0 sporulation protein A